MDDASLESIVVGAKYQYVRNEKIGAETPAYRHPMPPPRPLPELDELSRESDPAPIYRKAMAGVAAQKRLIDANAIKYTLESSSGGWGGEPEFIATKEEIDKIPTVDAVEVVRCRFCKKWNRETGACSEFTSHRLPTGGRIVFLTREADFCSFGERRDSE